MTKVVHKHPLFVADDAVLTVPAGAQVLHVAEQGNILGQLQVWCLVDPHAVGWETLHLKIRGTGHPVGDDCGDHVATVPAQGGALVWHIFRAART